jgi:futalosine hydrolase
MNTSESRNIHSFDNAWIMSATADEVLPLIKEHHTNQIRNNFYQIRIEDKIMHLLITGVGIHNTIFSLMEAFSAEVPALIINAGIAGSFRKDILIGEVVWVTEDRFADIGAEDRDGSFISTFEMGFENPDSFPYTSGALLSDVPLSYTPLQKVRGITVNKVHGSEASIKKIQSLYQADVESMEGAAVMFTCLKKGIQVIQLRAVSNYVTPRNKAEWQITTAINHLNQTLVQILTG